MRRFVAALAVVLVGWLFVLPGPVGAQEADEQPGSGVVLHLFHLDTCPHCAVARAFLAELTEELPGLEVRAHEVSSDAAARALFAEMAAAHGIEARSVPTIFLGDEVWVGFDDRVAAGVRATAERLLAADEGPVLGPPAAGTAGTGTGDEQPDGAVDDEQPHDEAHDRDDADEAIVDVPLVGAVDVGDRSMVVATLVIGFVDGANPCSLWALTVLLALVLHSGSRRRVALVGATFLAITTALYGLYIVGIYTILGYAAYLTWIRRGVAVVAGGFGVLNLKDYLFPGRGPSLSIPEGRRPGIYRRARSLAAADRSLAAVLGGTALLAVGVSLAETPCTAGLPVLWTDMLAARDVSTGAAVVLFALYMALFLVDELVVFGAAVVTMRVAKLQEHHGRALKLVAGSVMVTLAGVMVLDPDRLDTVGGTFQVLAASAVVALVVMAAGRVLGGDHGPGPASGRGRAAHRLS
ncbi:MAG: glutaredoxin family protein [Actinomycetota bacterium]|nr:glutaredoxin family protein [Actinomycetota bacterium]